MPIIGGKTHHCGISGCTYKCSNKCGGGFCPKHQWACYDVDAHGKGDKVWYQRFGQSCGGCGKESPYNLK